jgi:hypothetical protein
MFLTESTTTPAIRKGRPASERFCRGCRRTMSAREFHDHSVIDCLETAKFERVWQGEAFQARVIDSDYYKRDLFSPIQSSLSTIFNLNLRSGLSA